MPDPNVSDRERLLRLIDGGPEVVKEVQEQRQTPAEKKPVPVVPASSEAKPAPSGTSASLKDWWIKSGLDASSVIKMLFAMVLLLFAIHSFSDVVKTMGKTDKTFSAPAPAAAPAAAVASESREPDELNIGLRLVGVDWGDEPVALLEDLKTGKTYFAKKNDKIKETRVKQILKDKVLVIFRGKNIELR